MRATRRVRRHAFVVSATLFILSGSASAALAHYVYEHGNVWENGIGKCLEGRSEISHGNGGGYTAADGQAEKEFLDVHCTAEMEMAPYYLRAANTLYKGSSLCATTSYRYNTTTDSRVKATNSWNTPCGGGSYENRAKIDIYYDGAWRGSSGNPLRSGYHTLPA